MSPLLFFFALVFGVLFVLLFVKNLLVSALIGFIIFYLLNPFANWLEKRKFSRLISTTIPFVVLTLISIFGIVFLLPILGEQISSLQKDVPKYAQTTSAMLAKANLYLSEFVSADISANILQKIQAAATDFAQSILATIPAMISNSLTVLILAPLIAFFMLLDSEKWTKGIIGFAPEKHKDLLGEIHQQISERMGGFIRARIIETFALAVFITFGLMILDFPYALLLGILGGVLNLIPYIGPVISAIPAFMIALIQNAEGGTYLWLVVIYISSQVFDGAILVPFLVAKIVNLHPLVVVISVMMGAQLLGVVGMIIAIPVCSILMLIVSTLHSKISEGA